MYVRKKRKKTRPKSFFVTYSNWKIWFAMHVTSVATKATAAFRMTLDAWLNGGS